MSRELIGQLKNLSRGEVNPRAEWLTSNREILLAQIRNTVTPKARSRVENIWAGLSIFLPQSFVYNVMRPVAVLMVGSSGWIATVDASYSSLPGEWLYPAKRAAERTQVIMASIVGAKTTETQLHVEFARRRANEAKKIVAIADPQNSSQVKQSVDDLKAEITSVNQNLDDIQTGSQSGVSADTLKNVKQDTEQINNVLQEVKADLLTASSTAAGDDLTKVVSEAKDMVKDTSVKAMEVMVAKHLEGDQSMSKEEVKQEITNSLENVATEVTENKQTMEGAKTVAEAVKTEMKGIIADGLKTNSASTTAALNEKLSDVAAQAKDAAQKSEAASQVVTQKIDEAQALLSSDDLNAAVDKVKEATEATKAVEKINDTTLKNMQTVLPVVSVIAEKGEGAVVIPVDASNTKDIVVIVSSSVVVPLKPATSSTSTVPAVKVVVTSTKK